MIALLAYLTLVSIVSAMSCHWDVDMMILQDTSESYGDSMDQMRAAVAELVAQSRVTFARTRMAVSSFIDKPSPFRGIGNGRGHPQELDYCYKRESNLMTDPSSIINAHEDLMNKLGSGGDGPENIYEAMIYAAIDLGIYNRFVFNTERPLVKFIIAATDDLPHYAGDVQKGINLWNGNNNLTDAPHFLDSEFITYDFGYDVPTLFGGVDKWGEDYSRLIEIKDQTTTDEYINLITALGPRESQNPDNWISISDPNFSKTGSAGDSYCATTEYPTLDDLKSVLSDFNVFPVVLLSQPRFVTRESAALCRERGFDVYPSSGTSNEEFMRCLIYVYTTDLAAVSAAYLVRELTNHTQADIGNIIVELSTMGTDLACQLKLGLLPWIGGVTAGATAIGCVLPNFRKKVQLDTDQVQSENLQEDTPESDSTYHIGEDTCSWDNYV